MLKIPVKIVQKQAKGKKIIYLWYVEHDEGLRIGNSNLTVVGKPPPPNKRETVFGLDEMQMIDDQAC